jgi:hypothetical protein
MIKSFIVSMNHVEMFFTGKKDANQDLSAVPPLSTKKVTMIII